MIMRGVVMKLWVFHLMIAGYLEGNGVLWSFFLGQEASV